MGHKLVTDKMHQLTVEERRQLLRVYLQKTSFKLSVIYAHTFGDYWIRQQEFEQDFLSVPNDHYLVIDLIYEGISLVNSGIADKIQQLSSQTNRDPSTIILYYPNSDKEDCKWTNLFFYHRRHCDEFRRSINYTVDSVETRSDAKTWALFVGRRTMPRLTALYDLHKDINLRDQCLLSAMIEQDLPRITALWEDPELKHDNINNWIPLDQQNFISWYKNFPIKSIDHYGTQDQYGVEDIRNEKVFTSLLDFRHLYMFELCFETVTKGPSFFPTEKTLRAIITEKPMLVYAPKHFLRHLQNIGFQTFDSIWDESYDNFEGPDRYSAMLDIVKHICSLPNSQQIEIYQSALKICRQNKSLLIRLQSPRNHLCGLYDPKYAEFWEFIRSKKGNT